MVTKETKTMGNRFPDGAAGIYVKNQLDGEDVTLMVDGRCRGGLIELKLSGRRVAIDSGMKSFHTWRIRTGLDDAEKFALEILDLVAMARKAAE
jgi:hypothetical protein